MFDASGRFSLGELAMASAAGATISSMATVVANHALGRTTSIAEFAYAATAGALLGPLAMLSPVAAIGVASVGVVSSSYLLQRVFSNPDATYVQKAEAVGLVVASIWGARVASDYYNAAPNKWATAWEVPPAQVPQYPLPLETPEGIILESPQSGLRADKIGQIPGIMKSMLDGLPIDQIAGYRVGNRYIISEGNHRMTGALELFKQTGDPRYVLKLLSEGKWDPPPANIDTVKMTQ